MVIDGYHDPWAHGVLAVSTDTLPGTIGSWLQYDASAIIPSTTYTTGTTTINSDNLHGIMEQTYLTCNKKEPEIMKNECTNIVKNDCTNNVKFDIKRIDVYNRRAIKITFKDGTYTTAKCDSQDEFSFDTGITICLMKRLLSSDAKNATRMYNRIMRDVQKAWDTQEKEKQAEIEKEKIALRKAEKAKRKKEARKARYKEQMIDLHAEAYLRALREASEAGL